MNSSCLSLLLLVATTLIITVQGDSFDKICEKEFPGDNDGSGDRCCTQWRMTFCVLEALPELARDLSASAARVAFDNSGCSKYTSSVGGNMPITCYWQYRKWAVITLAVVAGLAILIPTIVVIVRRGRRRVVRMY